MSGSNQVFSNSRTRYSDQVTTLVLTGTFQPISNLPFSMTLSFKRNGRTVLCEIIEDTLQACNVGDNHVTLDIGVRLPPEFRTVLQDTVLVWMNASALFAKDIFRWTFQMDGNIVITYRTSTYPVTPLVGSPAFGTNILGVTQGSFTYSMD